MTTHSASFYSEAFATPEAASNYEQEQYCETSYDAFIWSLQRHRVLQVIAGLSAGRELVHLDFATGTGRILLAVEQLPLRSVGLDISPQMLRLAAAKVSKAKLIVGDILAEPDLVAEGFDVITVFRFFLNAEPELRESIMKALAVRLRDGCGRLIFNIHGNKHSLRHFALKYRGGSREWKNEMSVAEVRRLVEDAGLEIEAWWGDGLCPKFLHRCWLAPLARTIDRWAANSNLFRAFSVDLLFVARPRSRGARI